MAGSLLCCLLCSERESSCWVKTFCMRQTTMTILLLAQQGHTVSASSCHVSDATHYLSQYLNCTFQAPCVSSSCVLISFFKLKQTRKKKSDFWTKTLLALDINTAWKVQFPNLYQSLTALYSVSSRFKRLMAQKFSWIASDFLLYNTTESLRKAEFQDWPVMKRKKL